MIELQEIIEMNQEDILSLLSKEESPIEIYCPKSTKLFQSTNLDIANDYAILAYVGQKLNEVSDKFDYSYVSPSDHDSVLFEVETSNLDYLAKCVLELSYGFDNSGDDEEAAFQFSEDLSQLIDDIDKKKIEPVCPDFIETYYEFINESEE